MERKLFYENLYLQKFDAVVLSQEERNGKFYVRLDQTAFYPESGGQPSDIGTIGNARVLHVEERDGEIWHELDRPLAETIVHCQLDWENRFELMQQHLGQHILSAVFVRDYHANTINLRMHREGVSIDLDKVVDDAKVFAAEMAANEVIYQNLPVEVLFPAMEEIEKYSKRNIPETGEAIRIIKIGDLDYTPCCGTQNAYTGEVGFLKVLNAEKNKNGTRIHFTCGRSAFRYNAAWFGQYTQLQKKLHCQSHEVAERVQKLQEELKSAKGKLKSMMEKEIAGKAAELIEKAPRAEALAVVSCVLQDSTQEEMKLLFEKLTAEKGVLALLGGETEKGAMLIFGANKGEKGVDIRPVFKECAALIDGKGGGSPFFAQGIGTNGARLTEAVQKATDYFLLKQ